MNTVRTNSEHKDFEILINRLDCELTDRDREAHEICKAYNYVETIKHVIVAYDGNKAIGCGAIRAFDEKTMEVKRMFVAVESRNRGVASTILEELEKWVKELGYSGCILETGRKFPDAIKLYEKNGYTRIPNYGQYKDLESSVCFKKKLI